MCNSLKGALNNLEHRSLVALVMAFEALLKVGCLYSSAFLFKVDSFILIGCSIIATIIASIPLIYFTRKEEAFNLERVEQIKGLDVFKFALPITIGAVLNWLQLQGYRMVLVPLGFSEMVGIYSTVSGIGQAGMGAAIAIYSQMYTPKLYKSEGAFLSQYIRYGLFLICSVILLCVFGAPVLIHLLTKDEFLPYSFLVIYGVLTEAGNFILGTLGIFLSIKNNTKMGLIAGYVSVIVMLACFSILYYSANISAYTIGLPLVISQIFAATILYRIIFTNHLTGLVPEK
jgi:O-antigen/teichoic acid export membrane protein